MDRDVDSGYKLFSDLTVAVLLKRRTGQNSKLTCFKNKQSLQTVPLCTLYLILITSFQMTTSNSFATSPTGGTFAKYFYLYTKYDI